MRTRGALGFESRRGRRYPLSLATVLLAPAIALAMRAGTDLNFESYAPLIVAAMLTALAVFTLFWRFDPQLRGDFNQGVTRSSRSRIAMARLLLLTSCSMRHQATTRNP
jgi:hypothetical protein